MADEKWRDFPTIDGRKFSKYEVSSLTKPEDPIYPLLSPEKIELDISNNTYRDG